jgi:hypothetical protein
VSSRKWAIAARVPGAIEGDTSDKSNNACHPWKTADFRGIAGVGATESLAKKNKIFFRRAFRKLLERG